jgi:hypothetical protein
MGPIRVLFAVGGIILLATLARVFAMRSKDAAQRHADLTRGIGGLGASLLIMGSFALFVREHRIHSDQDALRTAADTVVADAMRGARQCATDLATPQPTFAYPSGLLPSGVPPAFTPPPCSQSPREQFTPEYPESVALLQYKVEYSPSFPSNGEITIRDAKNGHVLCVTIPSTIDGSPSIANGACAG